MADKPKFYEAKIQKIVDLTSTVRHFVLEYDQTADTTFKAGQFLQVHLEKDGKPHKKPYSIASSPVLDHQIELCIKKVEGGYVSNAFHALNVGDHLPMDGPYGKFLIQEPYQDLIFVATGTGIAPFRSQIRTLFERSAKGQIWVFFGVRYEDQILYEREWRDMEAEHKNFHFIPTISRPRPGKWSGETGYVQNAIKKYIPDAQGKDVYICGIVPMVEDVKKVTQEMGFLESHVHFEKYT